MYVVSANFKVSDWETLARLSERLPLVDAAIHGEANLPVITIATCNRVEYYGDVERGPSAATIVHLLAQTLALSQEQLQKQLFVAQGVDAIEHLYRVTTGLEAIARGESEVGGQVRKAYTRSIKAGRISAQLRRTFDDALRVNRDLRRLDPHEDTNLVALSLQRIPDAHRLEKLLVVGTGEFARSVHQRMHQLGVTDQWNFSTSGRRVSLPFPTSRVASSSLLEVLAEVDIVISATGAHEPVITKAMIDVLERTGRAVPVLVDLAVTQDIDEAIDASYPVIRLEQLAQTPTGVASARDDKYVRVRAEMMSHRMEVSKGGDAA